MVCPTYIAFAVIALIFILLYCRFKAVQYYSKLLLFTVTSIIFACMPIHLFILRPQDYRNALIPAWLCRNFIRLLGISYEVRGKKNINPSIGGVVLINHQSLIDLVVLANLWPIIGRATVVAKQLILYVFPACYFWGTLFINRSDRKTALNKLNKESLEIHSKQAKLLMFPEGTRHMGDKLLPFKKGPFHIAIQSQSIIQPVVVSRYTFLDSDIYKFEPGHMIISILPEIDCSQLTKDDITELIEKTYKLMGEEYQKLNEEIKEKNSLKLS